MSITADTPIGRLAAEHPLTTRVFARHGIDYCCGGARSLREVCGEKGIETERLLDEIREELATPGLAKERWDRSPLGDLIEHILSAYHRPLREELPRLESMARKVLEVHREKDPERLSELLSVYLRLESGLEEHMAKEERILFPSIRRGEGAMADGPISTLRHEHDAAATALRRLRELTNDYEVPHEACNTWRALWRGLAALEESLHQHMHLENNVLFPRAEAGREEPSASGESSQ